MKSKLIFIVFCLFMFVCTSKAETVDKTAPIINSIMPMTTEFRGGEKIGFKVNASDDISGIFEILLTFAQVDAPTVEGTEYTFMIGLSKKGPISNANDGLNDFINGEKIYYGYVPNNVKEGKYKLFKVYIDDEDRNNRCYCMNDYYHGDCIVNDFNFPTINTLKSLQDHEAPILKELNISSNSVKVGEEIEVIAKIEDESEIKAVELFFGSDIYFLNKDTDGAYKTKIRFNAPGNYKFNQITLRDVNNNEETYVYKSKTGYIAKNTLEDAKYDVVVANEHGETSSKLPELKDIVITKSKVKAPSVVQIHIYADEGLKTEMGVYDENNPEAAKSIKVTDNGWNGNSYVYNYEITQYAKPSIHTIHMLKLTTADGKSVIYAKDPNEYQISESIIEVRQLGDYSYEIVKDIKADVTTSTSSLTVIDNIKNANEDATISIDTTKSTKISSDIFEAIKNTNKTVVFETNGIQWHFNGKNITNAKDIDVKTNVYYLEQYNNADTDTFDKALVIEFANNGKLPGKALIKVKVDYALRNYLGAENLKVYFRNTDGYDLISDGIVESQDGFYLFYIDHNSTYYLTNKKIEAKKIKNDSTTKLDNTILVEQVKEEVNQNIIEDNNLKTDIKDDITMDIVPNNNDSNKTKSNNYILISIIIAIFVIITTIIIIRRNKLNKE